jgi:tRNA uridine 5-carbamoylmethylation protein Kti12
LNGNEKIFVQPGLKRGGLTFPLEQVQWIAWHLQTPLTLCKAWNLQRQRQVPETVIEEFFQALQEFPPSPHEGFLSVNSVDVTEQGFDLAQVEHQLKDLMCILPTVKKCHPRHQCHFVHSISNKFSRIFIHVE